MERITAQDILTSDGRFPKRAANATQEISDAATVLATRVNSLLGYYSIDGRPKIVSGFRTTAANKAAGGAPNSAHLEGRAVDLADVDRKFSKWCLAHLELLEECGLWLEDPAYTKTWAHLQSREVPGKRVFVP